MRLATTTTCLLFALLALNHTAFADESTVEIGPATSSTSSGVLHNRKFQPDQNITDMELKADSGSLSRYSLKADLSYSGPRVDELSDPNMPNPDNRPRPNRTNISGFIGMRYRLDSDEAINASTGMHWYSPYQSAAGIPVQHRNGDENVTVANPQISYDRTWLAWAAQMRSSIKGSITTESYYLNAGQSANVGAEQDFKYNIGQSRWIVGAQVPLDIFIFHRPFHEGTSKKDPGDGKVSNYYLSYIPSLEYKFSEHFNFRTSVAFSYSNMRMHGSWYLWEPQDITQRVGFGWALRRDVYLNPYVNYYVERPKLASTSLNLGTTFSLF